MNSTAAFWLLAAVVVAAVAALGAVNESRRKRDLAARFQKTFGKIPNKKLSAARREHLAGYLNHHEKPNQIDSITWNDLDMDRVFARIDSTKSGAGEEFLYFLLHSPEEKEGGGGLPKEAVSFFEDPAKASFRTQLELIFHDLGRMGAYSFCEGLDALEKVKTSGAAAHVLALLAPFVSIAVLFFSAKIGIVLLLFVIVVNIATYSGEKKKIEESLATIRYLLRMKKAAGKILALHETIPGEDLEALRALDARLAGFSRGSFWVTGGSASGSPQDAVLDYIRMIFHVDLIRFSGMVSFVRKNRETVDGLFTFLGRIDAEISTASFAKSLPGTCAPVFADESAAPFFHAVGLYHPLLEAPVANDLSTDTSLLLTGSNASGKSTFLKSAALAALLAQTLHLVPAASYEAPRFAIYSSMALRDSIAGGASYFMVEIRSLKRIRDAALSSKLPVFGLIDEVLRGTNTVERIAASTEILRDLAGKHALLFAATHDGELTQSLSGRYANYHFEETWDGKDVTFSYRLHEGPATTRNAIRLLSAVGFDPAVTDAAEALARDFETTGHWHWNREHEKETNA
ncbi:MAG: hypothetical protein ACI4OJ_02140 [Lachnospiraceae bacterium]